MCHLEVFQEGISVTLCKLVGHGFGVGREGSHGIKNNAPKATKNCLYLIDIIRLY
jgi:hypothetical protein